MQFLTQVMYDTLQPETLEPQVEVKTVPGKQALCSAH